MEEWKGITLMSNRDVLHGVLYPNAHVDRSKKKKARVIE